MDSKQTAQITRFVRGTLRCQCPDEVFRSITVDLREPTGGTPPFTRLVIGDRLLIYLVKPRPGASIPAIISVLAPLGQGERTGAGYNRFRLVIASTNTNVLDAAAQQVFADSIGADARAHLHFVTPDDLPDLILSSLASGLR